MTAGTDGDRAKWAVRDSLICSGLVVLGYWFVLTHAHKGAIPLEDASMLLRYSKNFADGNGIVWNVGEHPVEGATDFLYMITVGEIARWTHLSVIVAARVLL